MTLPLRAGNTLQIFQFSFYFFNFPRVKSAMTNEVSSEKVYDGLLTRDPVTKWHRLSGVKKV